LKTFLSKHIIFSFFLSLSISPYLPILTQNIGINEEKYQVHITKTQEKIIIDGQLNEAAWGKAEAAQDFWQFFPFDTSATITKTEVKLTFDEHFLYIGAICYQSREYIITTLKRDFPRGSSDLLGINIDPFKDKLNGFNFSVNPYNVQREGLIANGQDLSIDWDNKWYSRVSNEEDKWIVELAIPFKTLRYKRLEGKNEWLINFVRNNLVRNEAGAWAPIPRNFSGIALAFSGKLIWDEPPPHPGANISIIPYLLGESNRDFQAQTSTQTKFNAGFDAKIAVTPALNLDLTFNPDFAQVEVDRQVTNLSRFELFFPERRQFFLENSDLFGSFGFNNINPFFSRRIGLAPNPNTGFNDKVPILAGVRLSGRIDQNWRIGLLNMQTARQEQLALPSTNFGMLAVQRRVFSRSNIAFFVVNKQAFPQKQDTVTAYFNRVLGLEYNLASKNNLWLGKIFYHQSIQKENNPRQNVLAARIIFNKPTFNFSNRLEMIGENFTAEVGFVPRTGVFRNAGDLNFVYYPKNRLARRVNNISIGPDYDVIYGLNEKRVLDFDAGVFGGIAFQNSAELSFAIARFDYTYLFAPFDPTNTGGLELPANTSYLYFSNRWNFRSNSRKPFYFDIRSRFGQYFNGSIVQVQSVWNFRWQPYGIFGLDITYNRIRLPQPYNDSDLLLIGPRAELAFTTQLFFTTVLQYNNQINNINLNARIQWRFKPVSDLFIVYTDNYYASEGLENNVSIRAFQPKNRALVVKLTYWLNL
jgi:hypothetical protein